MVTVLVALALALAACHANGLLVQALDANQAWTGLGTNVSGAAPAHGCLLVWSPRVTACLQPSTGQGWRSRAQTALAPVALKHTVLLFAPDSLLVVALGTGTVLGSVPFTGRPLHRLVANNHHGDDKAVYVLTTSHVLCVRNGSTLWHVAHGLAEARQLALGRGGHVLVVTSIVTAR